MPNVDIIFIESLKKDIEKITSSISDLMWDRKMYEDFVEILKNNSSIDKPNAFYDFIKVGYLSHLVLSICRQTDRDAESISLLSLLERIFSHPEKITKDWFSSHYKTLGEDYGRADFERNFGNLDFIDPSNVYADIGSLIFYTKEIRKYRDKRIAHADRKSAGINFDENLNIDTFNKAVKIIEELGIKYYLLLHQAGMPTLLPEDTTDDYRGIFHEPWIVRDKNHG